MIKDIIDVAILGGEAIFENLQFNEFPRK